MRWQFSLASLFLLTSIVCFCLASVRDYRVFIVATGFLAAAIVTFLLAITWSLGPGDDVPDLDE
jgi:hypothetical protein